MTHATHSHLLLPQFHAAQSTKSNSPRSTDPKHEAPASCLCQSCGFCHGSAHAWLLTSRGSHFTLSTIFTLIQSRMMQKCSSAQIAFLRYYCSHGNATKAPTRFFHPPKVEYSTCSAMIKSKGWNAFGERKGCNWLSVHIIEHVLAVSMVRSRNHDPQVKIVGLAPVWPFHTTALRWGRLRRVGPA